MSGQGLRFQVREELRQIPLVLLADIFAFLSRTGIEEDKRKTDACNNKHKTHATLLQELSKPNKSIHHGFQHCRNQNDCRRCRAASVVCTLKLHKSTHYPAKVILQVVRCLWQDSELTEYALSEWLLLHFGETSASARLLRSDRGVLLEILTEMNVQEQPAQKEIRQTYDRDVRVSELRAYTDHEEYEATRAFNDADAGGYGYDLWSLSTKKERKNEAIEAAEKAAAARAADTSVTDRRRVEEGKAQEAIDAYARAAVLDVSATLVSAGFSSAAVIGVSDTFVSTGFSSAAVLDVSATLVSAGFSSAAVLDVSATLVSAAPSAAEKRAASKKLATFTKTAGELRNKLKKALKHGEITSDEDRLKFIETASSLCDIMVKIRNCKIPGSEENEACFNVLVKSMKDLIEPVNAILLTAGSEIRFNFDLYKGPEDALETKLAKEEEDRKAAEEQRKFWEERERLAPHRAIQERVGFSETTMRHSFSPIAAVLMLEFIDKCQSPPEAVAGPHAKCQVSHYVGDFSKFEREIDALLPLFVTDPTNRAYLDKLHPFHSEWICCKYDSNPTSWEYPRVYLYCPYCTILLICGIIIDNQKKMVKTGALKGWYEYLDTIMVFGMQQRVDRRFHYLLMCVYLRSKYPINPMSSNYDWKTNPINAILGLDQSLQGHFIGALKGCFNQAQIRQKMAEDVRLSPDAFTAWRKKPDFKP